MTSEHLSDEAEAVLEKIDEEDVDFLRLQFTDTDDMNDEIKSLLTDPAIKESNTSVVLNAVKEHEQFMLDVE